MVITSIKINAIAKIMIVIIFIISFHIRDIFFRGNIKEKSLVKDSSPNLPETHNLQIFS